MVVIVGLLLMPCFKSFAAILRLVDGVILFVILRAYSLPVLVIVRW